jgi:hypothetical protein
VSHVTDGLPIATIKNDRAKIGKAEVRFDPFACFDEWNSEADREGYASL